MLRTLLPTACSQDLENRGAEDELQRPSFKAALGFWWKLGWISFGGTAARIAIMHDELVEQKRFDDAHDLVPGNARILNSGHKPSLASTSLWQIPQAATLIRTHPGCGVGIVRSTISKTAPGLETCATLIVANATVVITPPVNSVHCAWSGFLSHATIRHEGVAAKPVNSFVK